MARIPAAILIPTHKSGRFMIRKMVFAFAFLGGMVWLSTPASDRGAAFALFVPIFLVSVAISALIRRRTRGSSD